MKEAQRTCEGEIAFLRARLDFHMEAASTVAQRSGSDATGHSLTLPTAAETSRIQLVLEETRQQLKIAEQAKQDVDEKLATADAGRRAAEMRVEHARRSIKQLQLALDSERLTVARSAELAGAVALSAPTPSNAVQR